MVVLYYQNEVSIGFPHLSGRLQRQQSITFADLGKRRGRWSMWCHEKSSSHDFFGPCTCLTPAATTVDNHGAFDLFCRMRTSNGRNSLKVWSWNSRCDESVRLRLGTVWKLNKNNLNYWILAISTAFEINWSLLDPFCLKPDWYSTLLVVLPCILHICSTCLDTMEETSRRLWWKA